MSKVEVDIEKIKQVMLQNDMYWYDHVDATEQILRFMANMASRVTQAKRCGEGMNDWYAESSKKAWEMYSAKHTGLVNALEKAKRMRETWHIKKQKAESKADYYKKSIDMCPVPGGGWGNTDVAVKQCESYRAWYFKYIKPILDKEPMT